MSASASWIKPILDVLESKTSAKVLGAIFVITLVLLCLPTTWKDRIYMTPFVSWLWPWIVIICAFCGLMLLFTAIDLLGGPKIRRCQTKRRIDKYLNTVSRDEIVKLVSYGEAKTQRFYASDGAVQNLVKQGILYQSATSPGAGLLYSFTVTVEAEPFLRRDAFQKRLDQITKRQLKDRQASTDDRSNQKP
jgi:hypothetical protein